MFNRILPIINWLVVCIFVVSALGGSTPQPDVEVDLFSDYTRGIRFEFLGWVADASWIKFQQAALGIPYYIERADRKEIVVRYLRQMEQVLQAEWELSQIYTNPEISDPKSSSEELRMRLNVLYEEQDQLTPFVESVLEEQISVVLAIYQFTLAYE